MLAGWSVLTFAQETALEVASKISKVTVFLEGAQITRSSTVNLKSGVSNLSLTGIAAHIQEQSIQVDGPSAVKILSVSFRVNYLDNVRKPERVTFLESERRKLHVAGVNGNQLHVEPCHPRLYPQLARYHGKKKSRTGTKDAKQNAGTLRKLT